MDIIQTQEFLGKKFEKDIVTISNGFKLPVLSLFPTYEGEGHFIGEPRIFLRLSGCAVLCGNCDSKFTWSVFGVDKDSEDTEDGVVNHRSQMFAPTILAEKVVRMCIETGIETLSLTGGEPMHYPRLVVKLIQAIDYANRRSITNGLPHIKKLNLETSGLVFSDRVFEQFDTVSMDIKTPSSGVILTQDTIEAIQEYLTREHIWPKAIVTDEEDVKFLVRVLKNMAGSKARPLVITPNLDPRELAKGNKIEIVLQKCDRVQKILSPLYKYGIRFVVQQHKYLDYDTDTLS